MSLVKGTRRAAHWIRSPETDALYSSRILSVKKISIVQDVYFVNEPHACAQVCKVPKCCCLGPTRERRAMLQPTLKLWTVGHSTHSFDEFIGTLGSFEIRVLADVRSFPGSRRYPHFNREQLSVSLANAGIEYQHFPELGGRRNARPDSINMAWRNKMFRGYADYMETDEFRLGIARLLESARACRTAIMCAEAVWWRCHRSLISDYLKASGVEVTHIMAAGKSEPHPFTSAARIVNGELSYRGILES